MADTMEKADHKDHVSLSPIAAGGPQQGQVSSYIKPQDRKLHDPNVTLEEYHYYAQQTREIEKTYESPKLRWREIIHKKKGDNDVNDTSNGVEQDSKVLHNDVNFADPAARAQISDEEWVNASRAFRTASWGAVFYLITTGKSIARP